MMKESQSKIVIDSNTYEAQKQKLLSRRRRVVYNNDGCDVFAVPAESEPTPENLLAVRTRGLENTHVDVISYTTISSGFGLFTHNTQIGEVLHKKHPKLNNNIAPALINTGCDCLKTMVEYGHAHDKEVFWSMRMNDTHDGAHREDKPYFLFPEFKRNNSQYLMGTPGKRPAHGSWSAVNYGHAEVRERAYGFIDEVCRNYDVDGIELDFFRHPVFFKHTSQGLPVGDEERDCMTDLMRKIQTLIREVGMKRGRPLLVAVRTPDDVSYCNTIGLEIERWMAEGLIDIFIPSAYIRLNSWEYSVRLAHQYGVKIYPGLSESRVGGGHHADPLRSSDECYRARALNAWDAGADGVYIFNLFDPQRRIWNEMGEPDVLQRLDKLYFASARGVGRVAGGAYPHRHFITIPTVNPDAPLHLKANERAAVRLRMGEEFTKNPHGAHPEIKLHLKTNPGGTDLKPVFNGRVLQGGPAEYGIDPMAVRKGVNVVEVYNPSGSDSEVVDVMISVDFTGQLLSDR